MAVNVCPADTVQAPARVVWELLMRPAEYGRFWDVSIERVEPEGPAAPGQRFLGSSRALGRRWRVEGEVREVDHSRRQILFRMILPLGLVSDNHVMCTPIDERSCMLRYG
jgi:hypothetical protein